jgi:amino acid adenylation domain-containing protein
VAGPAAPKGLGRFSADRQKLLRLVLADKGVRAPEREVIAPRARPGRPDRNGAPPPLSFAQQRLWVLDRLDPGSAFYNVPLAVRLEGRLDLPALLSSLIRIVQRHEALRTTFGVEEGRPFQAISEEPRPEIGVTDLTALPPEARAAEAARLVPLEASRPFDLQQGPLIRTVVLRLGEDEHIALVTMHHIVSDGWSCGVLLRETAALYDAASRGLPPPLPPLPIQYADFAAWQRERLSGPALDEQLGWWRDRLSGAPEALDLPTDRPRPATPSFRGSRRPVALSVALSDRLRALALQEDVTLFMVLLAAFGALLGRISGQGDVVIGTPIANRHRAEIEGLIGFFVNTLALRVDASRAPGFRELLGAVRETAHGAYAHQDLPFERLVEELHPERATGRNPLFQVMFALQNTPVPRLDVPGLALEPLPAETGTAKFDLSLFLSEVDGRIAGELEYATELFDPPTIDRLAAHLERFLEEALAHPEERVSELPLLTAAERHQLLIEWNDTEPSEVSGAELLHELFEAQAARTPDAVALIADEARWTYRELDRRAEEVANQLRALGVGRDDRVAISLPRTPEMIAAMLGVLKAGGAYVPVDPAYPEARREAILANAGARPLPPAPSPAERERGSLSDQPGWEGAPSPAPRGRVGEGGALAYLIYTSGSTGEPKGVAITHRSAVALVRWAQTVFSPDELSRVLAATSINFDLSVFEIFVPLSMGGAVVLAADALALPRLPAAGEVTLINTVPSAMSELARAGAVPPFVRTINLAGEPLPRELADTLSGIPGVRRVWNLYGPSEDTTYSTFARIERGDSRAPAIGRPVTGTRVRLLDRSFHSAPIGIPGELCLGGDGLARGYLGRPALTAERWVPDPFPPEPGARIYRTGDLARFRPDGALEFLGRIDHQVKVRGFRIELGEIETTLRALPGVTEAAVLALGEGAERRLAAFVAGDGIAASALREALRGRLPEHMIPARFAVLDALPLTLSGKVDRRALARMGTLETREPDAWAAPRGPVEDVLAGAFSEVLGVARIGARDHFFELGGHSLLAMRALSRVRSVLGVDLPLRAIFEAPTVEALARRIDEARGAGPAVESAPLRPVPRDRPLPLSFAQERMWFLDRLTPGSPIYNIPEVGRYQGALRHDLLAHALVETGRRHESLRTRFGTAPDGRPIQVIDPEPDFPLPLIDLSLLPEEARLREARRVAETESLRPFDLARGPVLRAALLRLGMEDHVTVLTRHHIVADGWSMELFGREISALYGALRDGRSSPLPPPPIQYADFAAWQREHLSGTRLEPQIDYWRHTLAGAPPLLQLPADRPRPPIQTFRGEIRTLNLDTPALRGLRTSARRQGGTLFMLLLTAFEALIQRYTGRDDLLIGTPVANRHRPELEALMGFLANTLVLRTELSGDPPFREALARVRRTALEAYENQDVPFERVVEELKPKRDLSHAPIFQVMFVQQAEHQRSDEPSTLQEAALGSLEAVSRFDFELYAIETPAGLTLAAEYNVDLFDRVRIDRALGHLRTLLDAAVADPERHLSALPLLTAPESHQLLIEQIGTEVSGGHGELLHELFEAQAARTPDAVALISWETRWTYRELDERAEAVAAELRGQGIGPEDRVGVLLPRTPEMIAALLGILKAGAAYVPIDPNYPEARRARIVADAGPLCPLPPAPSPAERERGSRGQGRVGEGGNLAYLIYTSGSTGEPKGVAVPHAAAVALVRWAAEVYSRADLAGVLAATSINFDLSVFEIFVPLSRGGTVILAENALELPRLPAASEVTLVNTVPSAMDALVRTGGVPASVRVVNLAGEALTRELADRIHALPHVERLYDLYGPSEDTTYSTFSLVPRGVSGPPTIGKPIAGTRAVVVDRWLRPAPLGVPGELCLAGAGLARGYRNKPAATAEKWVPDPFADLPGERMYRTGDLVRRRADGELEFLGRIDHQLKVRGFRVEPGEIEALLRAAPGVEEVVVGAWTDTSGDARLVAWVAGENPEALSPETLRGLLRERLPEPLVPSFFVPLKHLPRSATGKVDRSSLPDPVRGGAREESVWVAPRTPLEQTVADLWTELLGHRIGLQDDFFHLGGHSLLAARYIARLRDALGIDLPVRAVFEAPTVAGQARQVLAGRLALQGAIPSRSLEVLDEDAPLSFAQERMWFLQRLAPEGAYHIPAALRLLGRLRVDALENALGEIVRRHGALRTVFPEVGGRPMQRVLPNVGPDLARIDLTALPEQVRESELRRVAGEVAGAPFDLERRPPLRAALIRLTPEEHLLAVTPHHIVFDGWSIGVFVSELAALYRGDPDLPALPIQYVDWSRWQRERLDGSALAEAISWWRSWLGSDLPALDLPADRPRPPIPSQRGATLHLDLPLDLTAKLRALGRERRASLFMALLAGFQILLHRLTGQETVIVGTPVAGRERTEVEGLIGLFVNTLALRSDRAASQEGFGGWLAGTRERVLDAWAHQEVPFERLVEELQPRRSLAHTPVFQALFVLQNAPLPPLDLPGLHLEPLDVETGRAPFDLSVDLVETSEGLRASWLYTTDLFEPSTIGRFAESYRSLFAAAVAEPDRPLADLPILAEAERQAVLTPAETRKAAWEAPRTLAETLLAGLWTELLDVERPGRQDGFFDLGGHSLLAVWLLARVQESCGVELVLRDVFAHPTLAGLAARIEELAATAAAPGDQSRSWSPLVRLAEGKEGEAPLFCIHGGGGSVLVFADLARALGEELPVFGLEARGLAAGPPPLDRIEAMADLYLEAIREVRPRGPYRLLGYSIGGKVAFEIARRLEAGGEPIELLAVLDIPAVVPEGADEAFESELAAEVADFPQLDPESVRRHLAVWRASWKASRSWSPGSYGGQVLLMVAEKGEHPQQEDPTLGWSACAAGGVEVVTVPGGHFTLLAPPHVGTLARSLHHLVR